MCRHISRDVILAGVLRQADDTVNQQFMFSSYPIHSDSASNVFCELIYKAVIGTHANLTNGPLYKKWLGISDFKQAAGRT